MVMLILFLNLLYMSLTSSGLVCDTADLLKAGISTIFKDEAAPLKCPDPNITFWLYTENNRNGYKLEVDNPATIEAALSDVNCCKKYMKMLMHGFGGDKYDCPNDSGGAYLDLGFCVLSIDYSTYASPPNYIAAAESTKLVGQCTAQLVDLLVKNYTCKLENIHCIGFSLGAHALGYFANYINKTGVVNRISGLDPAGPCFIASSESDHLDKSDAKKVDIYHTNGLCLGLKDATGSADFYFNGGTTQPNCPLFGNSERNRTLCHCSHFRVCDYWKESINSIVGFYGVNDSSKILCGEPCNVTEASGNYAVKTNPNEPYAKGK